MVLHSECDPHKLDCQHRVRLEHLEATFCTNNLNCGTIAEFFDHNITIVALYLPYSPDLTPCDFFIFTKMKFKLRFDIQCSLQMVLNMLLEQHFQGAFTSIVGALGAEYRCTRTLL